MNLGERVRTLLHNGHSPQVIAAMIGVDFAELQNYLTAPARFQVPSVNAGQTFDLGTHTIDATPQGLDVYKGAAVDLGHDANLMLIELTVTALDLDAELPDDIDVLQVWYGTALDGGGGGRWSDDGPNQSPTGVTFNFSLVGYPAPIQTGHAVPFVLQNAALLFRYVRPLAQWGSQTTVPVLDENGDPVLDDNGAPTQREGTAGDPGERGVNASATFSMTATSL